MAGFDNGTGIGGTYSEYAAQGYDVGNHKTGRNGGAAEASGVDGSAKSGKADSNYGKTIGEPKLSEKAQKYYEQLKKKYGNYDFILVSSDQKANAQANASRYANNFRTVVLIDEEKIEKMAEDESYRKQYEGILSGAASQLAQLKSSVERSGAKVQGYGLKVNDDGTTSLFAVLKKSSADQKTRIEKGIAKKRAEKKAAVKKAEKKEKEERLEKTRSDNTEVRGKGRKDAAGNDADTVTVTAGSVDELLQKINDYMFNERSNYVQTEEEKMVGQHFDFRR